VKIRNANGNTNITLESYFHIANIIVREIILIAITLLPFNITFSNQSPHYIQLNVFYAAYTV